MSPEKLLLVTDGLLQTDDGYQLHPALDGWQRQLSKRSRSWFASKPKTVLDWYAEIVHSDPGTLLHGLMGGEIEPGFRQLWIASPYHARLSRDRLHVMPDPLFIWSASDSRWICELLNPHLNEGGMKLISKGECLALLCKTTLDAAPASFAAISGNTLPNRHPDGADGGVLMRLTAEIQMILKQHPSEVRRSRGEPDVDGLWFWGKSSPGHEQAAYSLPVATRNPLLRAVADAVDAEVIMTESERLIELKQADSPLPARVVLTGCDHAVLLKHGLFTGFGKSGWKPASIRDGVELTVQLQRLCTG